MLAPEPFTVSVPDEELDDLLAYTQQHSPVCNTVCRPVPVLIQRLTS